MKKNKHIRLLTASLLFVAMVLFSHPGWSQEIQEIKISGSYSKTPLQEVFSSLEKNYGIHFFYKTEWIASKDFTGSFDNQPLIQVVNRIVEGKELNSRFFQNNSVFVFPANADKDLVTSKEESKMLVVGDPINQGRFKRAKIQGRVFEGKTGDPLMGAVVYNPETKVGVASDARGRYSIDLPCGQVHLQVSFMSFENQFFSINLIQDGKVDFDLFEKSFSIAELTVIGENSKASKAQMSMIKMSSITVKELPVLMGEADLIKSMVMMPGVQSVGEMSSGFNVRGGNTDQNLILVNGAPVFNTTHLFGFFSMINPDAVEDVTLYKGGIPASYGERISSVMDVQLKQGDDKKLSLNGGIGMINSRLTIEGPLSKKKKNSFLLGGRTTYSDYLLQRTTNPTFKYSIAKFYDLNATFDFELGPKNHLKLMGYMSSDAFNLNTSTLYNYGNALGSLNWKMNLSDKIISNLSLAYSKYDISVNQKDPTLPQDDYILKSNIQYGSIKYALSFYPNDKHRINTGFQAIGYLINPGEMAPAQEISNVVSASLRKEQSAEMSLFADDDFDLTDKLAFNVGLRYTKFNDYGPGMVYSYAPGVPKSASTIIDSTIYKSGDVIKSYGGLEPRISMKYLLQEGTSFRFSYQRIHQFYNQISNNAVISPADYWKSADVYIPPVINDQIAVGYFKNSTNSKIETSVELYYKKLQNLIEYKNGAKLVMNPHIETDLMVSRGYSYGLEFMVKKSTGRLNGWISYTYSRTFRKGDSPYPEEVINNGSYYPSVYDKPHDLSAVMNYKISRRWRFSSNFVFSSGRPITLPEQKYMYADNQVVIFSDRNKYRMPPYHRMDVSLTLDENLRKRHMWKGSWTFSVYNLYGRKNTYSVFYKKSPQQVGGAEDSRYDIFRMSIIGIPVPSITYNFKF
ncbi:MAG: TonB-dependent receptor [Bacteroidia bacterium]|nr:TonB-dependent receptor [Bacteroidia bacterium]